MKINTNFFLNLERSRQIKKNIKTLNSTDGRIITDQSDILNELVNDYKNLYTTKINDTAKMTNYLNSTHLAKALSQTDMQVCEQKITPEERKLSLFWMKLNKSPGSDGLSVEFYQAFWDHLWGPFMNSLNESIRKSQLMDTQGHRVLSLIFKSGDETNLNNWRP